MPDNEKNDVFCHEAEHGVDVIGSGCGMPTLDEVTNGLSSEVMEASWIELDPLCEAHGRAIRIANLGEPRSDHALGQR